MLAPALIAVGAVLFVVAGLIVVGSLGLGLEFVVPGIGTIPGVTLAATGLGMVIVGSGMLLVDKQETRYQEAYDRYIAEYRIYDGLWSDAEQAVAELGEQRIAAMVEALSIAEEEPEALDDASLRRVNETYQDARRNLMAYQAVHALELAGDDAGTPEQQTLARGLASATGAASQVGAYGITQAFGTAGTGAAISGLSGAAQHSATMAALGGGTMAGGASVLAGIAAAPVLIAAASYEGWRYRKVRRQVNQSIGKLDAAISSWRYQRSAVIEVTIAAQAQSHNLGRRVAELRVAVRPDTPSPSEATIDALVAALEEPIVPQ